MKTGKKRPSKKKAIKMSTEKNYDPWSKQEELVAALIEEGNEMPTYRKQIINRFLSTVKMNKKYLQSMKSSPKKMSEKSSFQKNQQELQKIIREDFSPRRVKTQTKYFPFFEDKEKEKVIQEHFQKKKKSLLKTRVINLNQNLKVCEKRKSYTQPTSNITKSLRIKEELRQRKNIQPFERKKKIQKNIQNIFNHTLTFFPTTQLQRSNNILSKQNKSSSVQKVSGFPVNLSIFSKRPRSSEKKSYQLINFHEK